MATNNTTTLEVYPKTLKDNDGHYLRSDDPKVTLQAGHALYDCSGAIRAVAGWVQA